LAGYGHSAAISHSGFSDKPSDCFNAAINLQFPFERKQTSARLNKCPFKGMLLSEIQAPKTILNDL